MVCCAKYFPRGPTYPAGTQTTSRRSPTPSTPDPARPSAGEPLRKPSPNTYTRFTKPVLRPPIESAQFRSRRFIHALGRHEMVGSMGRVGAAGDNAAMESFFSLLQKNVLDRRRWDTREELRIAIVTWIERTYHRRRRQAALGRLTPIDFETIMTTPASQAA